MSRCVPMVPKNIYFHDRSMTDAEIFWALHKRSQANMSPANSAMAMISISMAGEVQSPSTSANILGSTKCFKWHSRYFRWHVKYVNDFQWEVYLSLWFLHVFTRFYFGLLNQDNFLPKPMHCYKYSFETNAWCVFLHSDSQAFSESSLSLLLRG